MSEDSGSRLTVTLGRSGRVVKRSGGVPDAGFSRSISGGKRSVKDRLGTSVGDAFDDWNHHKNKRHRGEQNQEGSLCDSLNGTYLGRNDLRFKLRQKTESRQSQNEDPSSDVDLRVMLSSKATRPPVDRSRSYSPEPIFGTRRSMLEPGDPYDDRCPSLERRPYDSERQGIREPRDAYDDRCPSLERRPYDSERQGIREPRDSTRRQSIREHRDSAGRQSMRELREGARRQSIRELRDGARRQSIREPEDIYSAGRQGVREPRDCYDVERRSMPDSRAAYNVERERMREPRGAYRDGRPSRVESRDDYDNGRRGVLRPTPSRVGRDIPVTSHARTSYPSWTIDNIRRRSPDRTLSSSGAGTFSPDRYIEERRRGALMRTHDDDDGSLNGYRRYESPSPPRVTGPAISKKESSLAARPHTSAKAAPANSNFRAPNPPTVDGFLQSLGLERYAIYFKAEEVDFNALRQMGDHDLGELGIPMGPRKKILQALSPRPVNKPREARRS